MKSEIAKSRSSEFGGKGENLFFSVADGVPFAVPQEVHPVRDLKAMFYAYVLQSKKDGKWYTGSTKDLRKRLVEHNTGRIFSTKNRGPFEVIYYEACRNESDTRDREKYFKDRDGQTLFEEPIEAFPIPFRNESF